MTDNVTPIRKKTLWQNVRMMEGIVEAMEELVPMLDATVRPEHEDALEDTKKVLARLRERAETVEGPVS